jgi:hypothetical protein
LVLFPRSVDLTGRAFRGVSVPLPLPRHLRRLSPVLSAGPPPTRRHARQHTFGGVELSDLFRELLPVGIKARQPFCQALAFCGDIVLDSHSRRPS